MATKKKTSKKPVKEKPTKVTAKDGIETPPKPPPNP